MVMLQGHVANSAGRKSEFLVVVVVIVTFDQWQELNVQKILMKRN